jgi:hypothetical protein
MKRKLVLQGHHGTAAPWTIYCQVIATRGLPLEKCAPALDKLPGCRSRRRLRLKIGYAHFECGVLVLELSYLFSRA